MNKVETFYKKNLDEKLIRHSLENIYGIGSSVSRSFCLKYLISKDLKFKFLNKKILKKVEYLLSSSFCIEKNLKNILDQNIEDHFSVGTYKSIRWKQFLPCNGQRTRSNARTCKKKTNSYLLKKPKSLKKKGVTKNRKFSNKPFRRKSFVSKSSKNRSKNKKFRSRYKYSKSTLRNKRNFYKKGLLKKRKAKSNFYKRLKARLNYKK